MGVNDCLFTKYLVTATLCLGLAPRSQVLQQLRIGSTLKREQDGRYWIQLLAEMNKHGKPTRFALPTQLTAAYDYYLATVRPRLLKGTYIASQQEYQHDYVFFKRCGKAPRSDSSGATTVVTQHLIGRPINPHAFRAGLITTFYEAGATQNDMDILATIMAHDSTTARTYYNRPQLAAAAVETSQRVTQILGIHS